MKIRMVKPLVIVAAIGLFALQAGAPHQHKKMHLLQLAQGVPADGSDVRGSSAKLTRSDNAVWISVNTTGLPPGAYTNWWVVFNNPSACVGGCGPDDFPSLNPAAMASVFFATGGVVGQNGVGHFRAHLEEGELPTGPGQVLQGPGVGLLDAQGAEIHYVLRYHGPVQPDILEKQITTGNGGCFGGPTDPNPPDRRYPCYDPQAAAFLAP